MVAAIQVAGSFMAVLSFGLVLEMPRKYLGWSGADRRGVLAGYLVVKAGTGSMILGAFLSSLSVALMGHLFAKDFQGAGQCVPGAGNFTPGARYIHL